MNEDSSDLYDWVEHLFRYGARMAAVSLRFVRVIWLCTAVTLLGGIYYLIGHQDAHWFWPASYGIIALIPVIVLTYYHWMLTGLTKAPSQLGSLRETLARFQEEHPEETRGVLQHRISALGRWKTYKLIGKVVKDIITTAGDISSLAGYVKILSAMANPLFWLILIVSMVLALVFSGFMIVTLSLLLFFS